MFPKLNIYLKNIISDKYLINKNHKAIKLFPFNAYMIHSLAKGNPQIYTNKYLKYIISYIIQKFKE